MLQPHLSSLLLVAAAVASLSCGQIKHQPQQLPQVTVADELAAMTRLQAIADAQAYYQIESGGSYASLEQLVGKGFMLDPSKGKLAGYRFDVRVKANGFEATAVPVKYAVTGRRSFYIDESRVMRGADRGGDPATASDPAI